MQTKIKIDSLKLFFGEKEILKGVNLEIPAGKIVALIGPSGSGKSVLLRAMNRMHDLTPNVRIEGNIFFDDRSIYGHKTDVVEIRKRIGMVFQKPNPFPKSIFENVAFGWRINYNLSKQHIEEKVYNS